jgi:hypothetical protein
MLWNRFKDLLVDRARRFEPARGLVRERLRERLPHRDHR